MPKLFFLAFVLGLTLNPSSRLVAQSHAVANHTAAKGPLTAIIRALKYRAYHHGLERGSQQITDQPDVYRWYNAIALPETESPSPFQGKLFLGALPIQYDEQSRIDVLRDLQEEGITHILSMVEKWEVSPLDESQAKRLSLRPKKRFSPITPMEWENLQIQQLIIPTQDYLPVGIKNINKGVTFLEEHLKEADNKVYVHCKSGKGRSVMIVAAFLQKNFAMTAQEAHDYIHNLRPQVHFNFLQKKQMHRYAKTLKKNNNANHNG